jgi:predicted homoserine dehydrogenase-like protein
MIENSPRARAEDLLPMGLTAGCRLVRNVAKDAAVSFGDVVLPDGRLADALWNEQRTLFSPSQSG